MEKREVHDSLFQTPASQRLVDLIERNAAELTSQYLHDVKQQAGMPTYRSFDEKEVYSRAFRVYSQLGKWLSQETTRDQIKKYWMSLGRDRRAEGFALSEIIQSLCLIRRHLWLKVESEGLIDTALELYQAIDLYNRVMVFFDRALYYAALGYEGKDRE